MNFGFNSNVRVGETVYHVQTEDRGPSHTFHDTVVYLAGAVVYKLSTSYADFLASADPETLAEKLHARLSEQHTAVISQLEAGTLPLRGKSDAPAEMEALIERDAIEVRLENPQTWLASGAATLEVSLRSTQSRAEVPDAEVEAMLEQGHERVHCCVAQANALGRATLRFPLPEITTEGACLVIRANSEFLYGELRFRLKSKPAGAVPNPVLK
jgi:hypothetical protein